MKLTSRCMRRVQSAKEGCCLHCMLLWVHHQLKMNYHSSSWKSWGRTAEFFSLSSIVLFKWRKMYRMSVLSIWTMSWLHKQESTDHSVTGVHKNKGKDEINQHKWHHYRYIEIGGAHRMRTWSGIRGNVDTVYANYVQSCWTAQSSWCLVLISCKLVCITGRCRKRTTKPQRGRKQPSEQLIDKQTSDYTCYLDTTFTEQPLIG